MAQLWSFERGSCSSSAPRPRSYVAYMSELEEVIKTQQKVIDYQQKEKHKDLYQILIVIDYFADDTNFTRNSQLVELSLFSCMCDMLNLVELV